MDTQYAPPKSALIGIKEWKRSKFLTAWLWFMLVTQVVSIPMQIIFIDEIVAQSPSMSNSLIYLLSLGGVFSVASTIALLRNKRWGYWGVVAISALAFCVNFYSVGIGAAITGLAGLVILTLGMSIGGKNNAWRNYS
ncbi:hypothetical protein [Alcanivorax sp.]|uniref:hypothetical protein n=1 Tax=Alcanivorax sp. TaxID=1872427 RepID=UPI0025C6774C|nr:hypothetical protein [Alcanivorax sp.]